MKPTFMHIFAVIAVIAAFLLVAGCTGAYQQPRQPSPPAATGVEKTVEITAAGFNPAGVEVNAGDTVTWVNMDSAPHRPASAQHPTHLVYPGSGADKCGAAEAATSNFDSCKGLVEGESWSFVFSQNGEWKYHDHLNCCTNPAFFGTVVVK